MDTATETEIKYDVPPAFDLPPLIGASGISSIDGAATHELDATYFDTDDLLLARNRRTLRRRTGGSDAGWHLKTPGDGASRTEHRLPLGSDADAVPAELLAEVRAIVRDAPVRPVARLRTRRVETPLRDDTGRTLALLAQDEVIAEAGGAEQRWTELEVELVDGSPEVLTAIAKRLRKAGATPAAGPSKLARALGPRLTGEAAPHKTKNPVTGYVRKQRDTIVALDPAVRHGDAEAIHKARVATRRLRSTLKTYRELWGTGQVTLLRDELKWLGERLGGVRDPQVQTARLASATDSDPELAPIGARLRSYLGEQLDRGRAALGSALNDTRYLRVLDELDELADAAPRPTGQQRLRRRARKALRKADGLLADADEAEGGSAERDEHLHEARKAYKAARYAVEVFVPSAGKPAKKLVKALTEVQDVLGTHQDSVVARQRRRDRAGRARAADEDTFGYGVLYARQEHAGEESLQDLPAARYVAGQQKVRGWL
jgi:CHAD domain-containing protein